MRLHELRPAPGATHRRKRVGRGVGSGSGTYAGRGLKGQKARSGGGVPPYFEGGQLPLVQRLPHKRGFVNRFRKEYAPVNLGRLVSFEAGSEVTPETMYQAGIIKSPGALVKVLGDGELDRALTVRAHSFSASAKAKIEAAGGSATLVERPGS
ncbi:MAG: 50S ribosomal protein L15 [Chloroflexi bacterium]|nr:50S ribosomal protein L15 [Chloroflexota bacterium]